MTLQSCPTLGGGGEHCGPFINQLFLRGTPGGGCNLPGISKLSTLTAVQDRSGDTSNSYCTGVFLLEDLDSDPNSTTQWLCDLGQVSQIPDASVSHL